MLKRKKIASSRFAKAGAWCFYKSEVLNSSFLHLMNFSGEKPANLQNDNLNLNPHLLYIAPLWRIANTLKRLVVNDYCFIRCWYPYQSTLNIFVSILMQHQLMPHFNQALFF